MNLRTSFHGAESAFIPEHSVHGAETMPEHQASRSFGNGEVESSILSGSTTFQALSPVSRECFGVHGTPVDLRRTRDRFESTLIKAPEKAAFGSPCSGCGFCCAAEPCGLARELIGARTGPCPAMEFDEARFWCGLIRRPGHYLGAPAFADEIISPMIAKALGAGQGCDSDDPAPSASYAEERT